MTCPGQSCLILIKECKHIWGRVLKSASSSTLKRMKSLCYCSMICIINFADLTFIACHLDKKIRLFQKRSLHTTNLLVALIWRQMLCPCSLLITLLNQLKMRPFQAYNMIYRLKNWWRFASFILNKIKYSIR